MRVSYIDNLYKTFKGANKLLKNIDQAEKLEWVKMFKTKNDP